MPQVINTNIASLNTQRNLNTSQSAQSTAIQRLSSGLRINSAKDDAAGLAISERFSAQIRGLNQAVRNAQDAVSLSQTAEGALVSIGNNLQRIRELAVQSANATNSGDDRLALQQEVTQLIAEIQRVATQTEFNGVKLLDNSFSGATFQVGANAAQTITIASIADARTSTIGNQAFVAGTGTATILTPTSSNLTINGVSLGTVTAGADAAGTAANVVAAVNAKFGETGVYATVSSASVTLTNVTGGAITVAGTAAADFGLGATYAAGTAVQVDDISVATVLGSQQALKLVDNALTTINNTRASLGAVQNRFESTISNLQTASENLSASRSRIQDADFAEETAKLTRAQILQQAGVAMLAQANALPQNVLALLRG